MFARNHNFAQHLFDQKFTLVSTLYKKTQHECTFIIKFKEMAENSDLRIVNCNTISSSAISYEHGCVKEAESVSVNKANVEIDDGRSAEGHMNMIFTSSTADATADTRNRSLTCSQETSNGEALMEGTDESRSREKSKEEAMRDRDERKCSVVDEGAFEPDNAERQASEAIRLPKLLRAIDRTVAGCVSAVK